MIVMRGTRPWFSLRVRFRVFDVYRVDHKELNVSRRTLFLCLFSVLLIPSLQAQYLRIYYPDIEQGSATLIVAPNGAAMLIDAGSGIRDSDTPIESFINDLIDAGVVTSVDYIAATHYDEDHIGRMENVYQYVPLSSSLVTYDRGTADTPSSFAYGDYAYYAGLHNRTTLTPNTSIPLGGTVTVRCYVVNGQLPDGSSVSMTGAPQLENALSAAFVVSYGDVDVWIGGDLTGNTTYNHPAVEQGVAPFVGDVDIYTVNHHGSSASSSDATFLATLEAEVAINQNSVDNNFGHATTTVVNRFKATSDTNGNTPVWFQTNRNNPTDSRSDDTLADGIADPDDIASVNGKPGNITVISNGTSYRIYGGDIEPVTYAADAGTKTIGDFPPAILETERDPLVPTASQSVTVEAEVRDEGAVTVALETEVDGVAQTAITMTKIPGTNRWTGTIPAETDGTRVTYRVAATDAFAQVSLSEASGYFSGTTDIADLYDQDSSEIALTKGLSARIEGNLTVAPGTFHGSVSQIYVQDSTGGINIFDNDLLALDLGDLVEFVGVIDQYSGALQLVIAEDIGNYGYTDLGTGSTPSPQLITLADLDEDVEGLLVRIDDLTVTSGSIPEAGNGNLTVTDDGGTTQRTIRIDGDTDITGANTPVGSFDIIGIASQFDTSVPLTYGYQVLPRGKADFISDEVNHPDIVISEILADPDGSTGDANGDGVVETTRDEFVEIVNTSFSDIDISGYTLHDGIGLKFTFPASTTLPAREAAVVFANGTPTGDFGNAAANGLVFTAGSLGLNNSGDTVTLKDASANVIQSVTYGGEGGDNQSLVRDPDWSNAPMVKHSTTAAMTDYSPGTRTDGTPYTLQAGDLLLSEIVYDPDGADGGKEWIELVNVADYTIDLSQVSIGAGGSDYTSTTIQLEGSVDSGETFVVGGPTSSSDNGDPDFDQELEFSLQNSGATADGVALFNLRKARVTSGTVPIDVVIYGTTNTNSLIDETGSAGAVDVGDAGSGQSIERTTEAGAWQIQALPTPNSSPLVGAQTSYGPATDVILTEVFYDYDGADNGLEWVEVHNTGSLPVNLASMSIGSGGGDYTNTKVQLGGVIPAGATWVIGGPDSDADNGNPDYDLEANFSPDLQNSGTTCDGVALFAVPASSITTSTVPIDVVIYGTTNTDGLMDETGSAGGVDVGDAPAGSSLERTTLGGSWQIQSTPDPGNIDF